MSNVSNSSVWNCSSLTVSDLQSNGNPSMYDVQHLSFENSSVDFKENLSEFFPNLVTVNLSNIRINLTCTKDLLWLLAWEKKILNIGLLRCSYPRFFNGTSLGRALELIKNLDSQCLYNCTCEYEHIPNKKKLPNHEQHIEQLTIETILMNCTNLQLKKLPKMLPSTYKIYLDLSNNQIENLNELSTNPNYKRVKTLYLKNNKISSLSFLENSEWTKTFNVLNLQGNNVQELPVEALSNALNDFQIAHKLYLSNNPFKCDCLTTKKMQVFLSKHNRMIGDFKNICCGPTEGENAGMKVADVDLSSVCIIRAHNALDLMDVLNMTLCLLIVCTMSKFIHDYYNYRKNGRLPWLAAKLPFR